MTDECRGAIKWLRSEKAREEFSMYEVVGMLAHVADMLEELAAKADLFDNLARVHKTYIGMDEHERVCSELERVKRERDAKWISITDRRPEMTESAFAEFYGTSEWRKGMFRKVSDLVLVTVEHSWGGRSVDVSRLCDGNWRHPIWFVNYAPGRVTHWMPLPEPAGDADGGAMDGKSD